MDPLRTKNHTGIVIHNSNTKPEIRVSGECLATGMMKLQLQLETCPENVANYPTNKGQVNMLTCIHVGTNAGNRYEHEKREF